jgi:Uma2 family endonuclease
LAAAARLAIIVADERIHYYGASTMAVAKALAEQLSQKTRTEQPAALRIPPLEAGDRLTRAEFERRYQAMPEQIKAELIEGIVYMPAQIIFRGQSERPSSDGPPLLEAGDHLTSAEFHRRYEAMSYVKKAELIEGVVFMPSPVHFKEHSERSSELITWLGVYRAATPGVRVGDNATLRLDRDNEPQPDAMMLLDATLGGNSRLNEKGYLEGAPELIVEVAASTASYDLHGKFHTYRLHGVKEYLVWRVYDSEVDWFYLQEDNYVRMQADVRGLLRSHVFPGLWLDVKALLKGEMSKVLLTLQTGLATPEHAAFVRQLKRRAKAK